MTRPDANQPDTPPAEANQPDTGRTDRTPAGHADGSSDQRHWAVRLFLKDRPFLVAAVIMAVAAIGWGAARELMGIVTQKFAVPWPEQAKIEEFRLRSLAPRVGPFVLARMPNDAAGEEAGDHRLTEDVMDTLGVGTSLDEKRVDGRRSNWYSSRVYIDARKGPDDPRAIWRLQVTYYTGSLDLVPHIGETCLVAGGAELIGTPEVVTLPAVEGLEGPWGQPLPWKRTRYARASDTGLQDEYVQFEIFSKNGLPEADWKKVRWGLAWPWIRYCYFAKITLSPAQPIRDVAAAQEDTAEFARHILPDVLKNLPDAASVEKLNSGEAGEDVSSQDIDPIDQGG